MTSSGTAPWDHCGLKFKWLDLLPHRVPWSLGTSWHLEHLSLLDSPKPQPPPFPATAELPACGTAAAGPGHQDCLPFQTVPQKDRWDGDAAYQVMAKTLWLSALLGLHQGFESKIFMPGVVPREVFLTTLWTTIFSVWVHCLSVSYINCNNSNWRQSM